MKQVEIVRRRVEELMYARNPNSPNTFNLYSNENPSVRMTETETEKKYYNE
jgi:hypothetical protein